MSTESINIAEFKRRMGAFMRRIRKGEKLELLDRDTPIAIITPYNETQTPEAQAFWSPPRRPTDFAQLEAKASRARLSGSAQSILDVLAQDRADR